MSDNKIPTCPLCGGILKKRSSMPENPVLRTVYYVCTNFGVKQGQCTLKSVSIYEDVPLRQSAKSRRDDALHEAA